MIRFLKHDTIDRVKWDNCIDNAINGNLNSHSWFLDIVNPGWCALIENDYENVFPLSVRSRAGFAYIMQPYFTQQLGLFSKTKLTPEKVTEFLNSIPSGFRYIDFNLNSSNRIEGDERLNDMSNFELDLSPEYAEISSHYQINLQRNLKKARLNKFTLTKLVKPEDMISLFRENKGQDLLHLKSEQYQLIQQIANQSLKTGAGKIWGVHDEFNQLIAAALWVHSHQKAIFLFSALSQSGKKLNAMPWLIDSFISEHARNALVLDFEGSNDPGLARFYRSFGAKEVFYQRYRLNTLPFLSGFALKLWRIFRQG